ncbi:MAG: group 1 truncated hemoglobin [Planctomycetia bacterium]|nr:group 1 truncated hemoglobin [Planctomycetia bacterium]
MYRLIGSLAMVLLVQSGTLLAQPYSPKDLDARIENQLYEVLKLGTDIYNRGGHDACYRLYQGSLLSILGFLDHRPESQTKIKQVLKDSDSITNVADRAFALRTAIDELRTSIKNTHQSKNDATPPAKTPPASTAETLTLWKRMGGEEALKPIVDDWVARSLANPRVNFSRRGTGQEWEANPENINKVKKQLLQFVSSITGGPVQYSGQDIKLLHSRMKISEPEFNAMMDDLRASLDKFFVSPFERNELMRRMGETKPSILDSSIITKPLWDRLGGETAITLVVDDFVIRAMNNPKVNFARRNTGKEWTATDAQVTQLKSRLVQWISTISQGPLKYEGKSMRETHGGLKITSEEYDALANDLKLSLEKYKVNKAEMEELLSLVNKFKLQIVER